MIAVVPKSTTRLLLLLLIGVHHYLSSILEDEQANCCSFLSLDSTILPLIVPITDFRHAQRDRPLVSRSSFGCCDYGRGQSKITILQTEVSFDGSSGSSSNFNNNNNNDDDKKSTRAATSRRVRKLLFMDFALFE